MIRTISKAVAAKMFGGVLPSTLMRVSREWCDARGVRHWDAAEKALTPKRTKVRYDARGVLIRGGA